MYDFIIVGSGLTGATIARLLIDKGKKVLVIDQNDYIGGACYTKFFDQLPVCQFGGHIFHTSNKKIWDFANKFSKFIPYTHIVKARIQNEYYSIPINLLTLNKLYGINSPGQTKAYFDRLPFVGDSNFEEKAISMIGQDLYEKFFYSYTKKQWGIEPKLLPSFIFSRLPVRYNLDERYFTDDFQGMPEFGYTNWITNILEGIEVILETPFSRNITKYEKLIYTGSIDSFYNYRFGKLPYRSVKHEYHIGKFDNFGGATVNYCGPEVEFTRTVTFNHFYPHIKNNEFITVKEWATSEGTPLYPISLQENKEIYEQYKSISSDVIFCGRLGSYNYINMDVAIEKAMKIVEEL